MASKIRCVHCNAENHIKKGYRHTQRRGKIQKYLCKECGKFFTADDGFYRMRNTPKSITQALSVFFEGLSSRKTCRQLEIFTETEVSHVSVLEWLRRYSAKIMRYTDTLKPDLGNTQTTDETHIRTEGEGHQFGIVMDTKTRYITGAHYWDKKGIALTPKDIANLWNKSKSIKKPQVFRTDGHHSYKQAFTKTFYTRYKDDQVEWEKNVTSKTKRHNVLIERLNRTLKDRLKTMGGFKSRKSAPLILMGWVLYYNHVRPHLSLDNQTPAQKAGLRLGLGVNKWYGLIRLSSI